MISRFNVITSNLKPQVRGPRVPLLILGSPAVVTTWHETDLTDRVTLEYLVVSAGRMSNIWAKNTQYMDSISNSVHSYVGSGIEMLPRRSFGAHCVVSLGAVVTQSFSEDQALTAGVPVKVVKELDECSLPLVTFATRLELDGPTDVDPESEAGKR